VFERDSLVVLAGEAGLDEGEARDMLERDAYVDAVAADVHEARSLGVSGVPFFVLDGRYGVSGAQAADVFAEALTTAWTERAKASAG
jgi:predicted DsbA family dithiol-disulfide isomerase